MRKILTLFMVGVLSTAMLVGCSKGENTTEKNNREEVSNEVAKKAVVMDFGTLDTIRALGAQVEVCVPVSNLPEYLSDYKTVASSGGIKEPDLEAIFDFEPDVIFISGRQESYFDELNKIAPTYLINIDAENYFEDFRENVTLVGGIFGKEQEAKKHIAQLEEKITSVQELTEKLDKKALILLTNDGNLSVYGKGSRYGIIHDLLGVKAADETILVSTHGQEASFEYILEVNPDILFVIDRTQVTGGNDGSKILDNEIVNQTTAAKEGKIINLSSDIWYLSGGGIQSVDAMMNDVLEGIEY